MLWVGSSFLRLLAAVLLTVLSIVSAACDDCAMSGDCTLAYKDIAPGSYCGRVGGVYCCCPLTMQCAATVFDCRCRNLPYPGYAPPQNLPMDRNDGLVVAIVMGLVVSLFVGAFCCVRHNCTGRQAQAQAKPSHDQLPASNQLLPLPNRPNRGYSHPVLATAPVASTYQRYDTVPATYGSVLQQQHIQAFDPNVQSSYPQEQPPYALPVARLLQPSSNDSTLPTSHNQPTYPGNQPVPAYAVAAPFATQSSARNKLTDQDQSHVPFESVYEARPYESPPPAIRSIHPPPSAPSPPRQYQPKM
ncbi:hypothetical protein H257_01289 [Aphanomyces astaci]|uniref:Uncharacterized protein n=1 Tax=Aphanomyces astaci TaxID=112090 RepID=W4H9A1_APHAT|nr:hypothetical protein H257_01289 [Aphanomyces astaci]ETV87859.1 hypothetical protein H257_01289 [Aphanomyces astaci]|eukprot:XP_009822722.1 hypothetical protein H257_01289 [Aphanomyces astaci]